MSGVGVPRQTETLREFIREREWVGQYRNGPSKYDANEALDALLARVSVLENALKGLTYAMTDCWCQLGGGQHDKACRAARAALAGNRPEAGASE